MLIRNIVAIMVHHRGETAVKVQQVLTGWGCMITTRLGLHEGVLDECTQTGLIIVEMVGDSEKIDEFVRKLNLIKGVQAKRITLEINPE
jgi:hypothetical protein